MRVHSGVHFAIVVIGALVACEHTEPFRPGAYGSSGPLHPGVVARLTFNPGQDLMPAWVPGSDVIVYTAERLDRSDHDRCLAFMPASGGAITRYICGTTLGDDSLNVYEETAVSADGQIVYVRASNTRALARLGPDAQEVDAGPLSNPGAARVARVVPLTTPWGTTYDAVSYLGWIGATQVVMIGDSVRYPRACSNCPADTVQTGIEIVTLGGTGDTLYFTLAGDSQVHRYVFSAGRADTVFDFGAGRLVRDVRVASGRLIAI